MAGIPVSIMTIVGPLLLVAVLLWVVARRNKGRNPQATEERTKALYAAEEKRRREGTDDR
ncbi:MAG: hypothetical protein ABIR63_02355 [Sphingomicrobium sp.]